MPQPKLRLHDRRDDDKARFLLDHPTTPDAAWTRERREKGESREAFIERLLGPPTNELSRRVDPPRAGARPGAMRPIPLVGREERSERGLFSFDRDQGGRYVCGADEAGRAPMAGPLVAAAVRFDYERLGKDAVARLADLDDSKKLSPRRRAALLPVVLELADMAAWVVIPAGQIDRDGLHVSNIRALASALDQVALAGSTDLVDGSTSMAGRLELECARASPRLLERGDQTSAAIAAASIVAKETRDQLMRELDADYPGWGFAVHKGYITRAHVAAVVELGLSPAHRRSVRCKAYATRGLSTT